MRYSYLLVLIVLASALYLAAPAPALAQNVDTHGKLLDPYAYSTDNTPWARVYGTTNGNLFNISYDIENRLDASHYYALTNLSDTLYPAFWINLNEGVNFTYTLRGGRTVQGSIYVWDAPGDPIDYFVTMNMDGQTVTSKHFKIPYSPIYLAFELNMFNNSGPGQYGIGLKCDGTDCGLVVKPVNGVSDGITSIYVSPIGQYYDQWYFVFSAPFKVEVKEMVGLYSTVDGSTPIYGTTTNPNDWIGQMIGKISDGLNIIITIYTMFMVMLSLLIAILMFILGPMPGKGIPGQNFMMMMLLLETAYTALILNTSNDIFSATRKWMRFQTSTYTFLMKSAEIMIRFFYWVFDAIMKLPQTLSSLGSSIMGPIMSVVAMFLPFL